MEREGGSEQKKYGKDLKRNLLENPLNSLSAQPAGYENSILDLRATVFFMINFQNNGPNFIS